MGELEANLGLLRTTKELVALILVIKQHGLWFFGRALICLLGLFFRICLRMV